MSDLLLDTHALIWWSTKSARMSAKAQEAIRARQGAIWVSVASIYEADYKTHAGRMRPLPAATSDILRAEGFAALPIDEIDAARAAAFNRAHSDPFDRLIAAQALTRRLVLVTADAAIRQFGAEILW